MTVLRSSTPTQASTVEEARALFFDEETGAVLWPLLVDRTDVALARARRDNNLVAVFALDNPRVEVGHPMHMAPAAMRERLASLLRPDDTVGRVAQRTFVVVCNEISADQDAAGIAQRLVRSVGIVAGLGIALGNPNDNAESLLRRALVEASR